MGPVNGSGGRKTVVSRVEDLNTAGGSLCEVCANYERCILSGDLQRNPSFCDNFSACNPEFSAVEEDGPGGKKSREFIPGEHSELQGLCKYCKKRDVCNLPRREGGVWNCDEYQE